MNIAIVQARMGSTRLPGKVMEDLWGKPVVARVVERLKLCEKVGRIFVAIPDTTENDIIEKYFEQWNVTVVRGPEEDVLARFVQAYVRACGWFGEEHISSIARITADCPFVDPRVVDAAIEWTEALVAQDEDSLFVSNTLDRTFPKGLDVEVFTPGLLGDADCSAISDHGDREHVTPWMEKNALVKRNLSVENDQSHITLCIDTPQQLGAIRELYFPFAQSKDFTTASVLWLLGKRPDLVAILAPKLIDKHDEDALLPEGLGNQ